jgi:hypothetical protein
MDKKFVYLDPDGTEDIGLCLVVEHPTGVVYGNQCGGVATLHRSVEGYLVPLGRADMEDEIYRYFMKEFGENCYPPHNEWTTQRTTRLNEILTRIPCWRTTQELQGDERAFLSLDIDRIQECVEAWIPVVCILGKGVLMLKNSD